MPFRSSFACETSGNCPPPFLFLAMLPGFPPAPMRESFSLNQKFGPLDIWRAAGSWILLLSTIRLRSVLCHERETLQAHRFLFQEILLCVPSLKAPFLTALVSDNGISD